MNRLPYVQEYRDRHGKIRRYFRRPGSRRIPLPGRPGSKEFMTAYNAAQGGYVVRETRTVGKKPLGTGFAQCRDRRLLHRPLIYWRVGGGNATAAPHDP